MRNETSRDVAPMTITLYLAALHDGAWNPPWIGPRECWLHLERLYLRVPRNRLQVDNQGRLAKLSIFVPVSSRLTAMGFICCTKTMTSIAIARALEGGYEE